MGQVWGKGVEVQERTGERPLDTPFVRRLVFAALVSLTVVAMCALMVLTLSRGGFDLWDGILTACFLVTLPWTVIGFWNAVIGLLVMRLSPDPVRAVCPAATESPGDEEIVESTALLVCVRNESAETVARNLGVMIEGIAAAGVSERFHVYILSD